MKISIKKNKYKKKSLHDNLAVMSYAEAEKMLRIQGCPTTEHILDKAKSKVNWPDEVWEQAEAIINANKQNKGKAARGRYPVGMFANRVNLYFEK